MNVASLVILHVNVAHELGLEVEVDVVVAQVLDAVGVQVTGEGVTVHATVLVEEGHLLVVAYHLVVVAATADHLLHIAVPGEIHHMATECKP